MAKKENPEAETLRRIAAAFERLESAVYEPLPDDWREKYNPLACKAFRLAVKHHRLLTRCSTDFGCTEAGQYMMQQIRHFAALREKEWKDPIPVAAWLTFGVPGSAVPKPRPFSQELRRWADAVRTSAMPNFVRLTGDKELTAILERRWEEVDSCLKSGAPLAAIILMGSILEGVLWSMANQNKAQACSAKAAPKDKKTNKVKLLKIWNLSNLIDVGVELKWIGHDVHKLSHSVRDYRNYVHPREELARGDTLDKGTCNMCWPVVQEAIKDMTTCKGI